MGETGKGSREIAVSLTDGEVHCAAMGGLVGRCVENKSQKYEIEVVKYPTI